LEAVDAARREVQESSGFKRVLGAVLALGNYMNGGTKNGQAHGFKLTALSRLSSSKALDNKTTLLQYLTQYIAKHHPDAANFAEETKDVKRAAMVEFAVIQAQLEKFGLFARRLKDEIALHRARNEANRAKRGQPHADSMQTILEDDEQERKGDELPTAAQASHAQDMFEEVMSSFLDGLNDRLSSLSQRRTKVLSECQALMMYFGLDESDVSSMPWERFFKLIADFSSSFQEELKKVEQQKQRASRPLKDDSKKPSVAVSPPLENQSAKQSMMATMRSQDISFVMSQLQKRRLQQPTLKSDGSTPSNPNLLQKPGAGAAGKKATLRPGNTIKRGFGTILRESMVIRRNSMDPDGTLRFM